MLYPLKFEPILKERLWGGFRLRDEFGKKIPNEGNRYGESWELSGVQGNLSVVTNGFLKGNNIQELIEVYMADLVGEKVYKEFGVEFPLLIKLIDTSEFLSIQVHPDDEMAKRLHHAFGKSEMWYIVDSEPESKIITGFNKTLTRDEFLDIMNSATLANYLSYSPVASDNYFYIPSGSIHSTGSGILLAEIQQTSDITYRIYDWDRVDKDGNQRELHIDLAADAINFEGKPINKGIVPIEKNSPQLLGDYPIFKCNRLVFDKPIDRDFFEVDSFIIYLCLEGKMDICCPNQDTVGLAKGELALVPAEITSFTLRPSEHAKILEVFV